MLRTRALGLVLGAAADAVLGDPSRHHPVAWFGSWAAWLEQRMYADDVRRGAAYTAVALAPVAVLGCVAERASRRFPLAHVATTGVVTWAVLGAHSLVKEGHVMAALLHAGDVDGARRQLGHLCSRDASQMDESDLTRATIESLAENTNDAVVASLWWGAVAGVPGMLVHRAANTLDAMVGYHNDRYERFGKVSALVDDVAAWLPARITGGLVVLTAGSTRRHRDDREEYLSSEGAWRTLRRDHAHHPSPNGGWCEAAYAGALNCTLGGTNVYFGRTETRPTMGDGPRPHAEHLSQACALTANTSMAAVLIAARALMRARKLKARRR